MRKWISIGCVVLLVGLLVAGCEKKESGPDEDKPAKAPDTRAQAAMAAGAAQTICPLMSGKIDKSIYADHDGKRVYFCCAGCVDGFKKDPAKHIKQMEDKGIVLDKTPD